MTYILLPTLAEKLRTNRSGITRRGIVLEHMMNELPKRTCLGGDVHESYTDFRTTVLNLATNDERLPSKYNVAALNFNNIRNDMQGIIEAHGGVEVNDQVYTDAKLGRDPGKTAKAKPRIPTGNWFVVNKTSNTVVESLNEERSARVLCDDDTQYVVSRVKYLTEVI